MMKVDDFNETSTMDDGQASELRPLSTGEQSFKQQESFSKDAAGKPSSMLKPHIAVQVTERLGNFFGGDYELFIKKKKELQDIEKRMHFSYDLEASLTDEERAAEQVLAQWRDRELKSDVYNAVIHDYFTNFVSEPTLTPFRIKSEIARCMRS